MRNLKFGMALVAVCAALAGCGGGDDGTDDTTSVPATPPPAQVTEAPSEAPTAAKTPKPVKTPKPGKSHDAPEGLPSTTPEPGPPVQFGATISPAGITPTVSEIPENKSLKVSLRNTGPKMVPINLVANGNVVGAGQIEGGDKTFVLVRNLLPGKLVFKSGKLRATVRVVAK